MAKAAAQQLVRAIRAPLPQGDGGTAWVELTNFPRSLWDDREYIRSTVARYVLRGALELGLTRIGVRHPARDTLFFDVADLIRRTGIALGYWPAPPVPGTPRRFALTGFHALGAEIAPTRQLFTVPTVFPVSPAPTGV